MSEFVYTIGRLPEEAGRMPLQGVFDPEVLPMPYAALQEARLCHFPWDENGYRPDCRARVGWNEKGLHVLMYANEPSVRMEEIVTGGAVCRDSCLEFFLAPGADPENYFNCEVSPRPTVHLGAGKGRHGRTHFHELPEGMEVTASVHAGGWWAVSYTVSAAFLKEYFGAELCSGARLHGNFYKCGDDYEYPHYGMFKPYDVPRPDYHRPERFADFILE